MEEFINFTAKIIKFVIMVAVGLVLTIGPIIVIVAELQSEDSGFVDVALRLVGSSIAFYMGVICLNMAHEGWKEDTL